MPARESIGALVHIGVAPDGSVVVSTSPAVSATAHTDGATHVTAEKKGIMEGGSVGRRPCQALDPPVGLLDAAIATPEANTHREIDGHEIPPLPSGAKAPEKPSRVNRQVGRRAPGFRELTTLPP